MRPADLLQKLEDQPFRPFRIHLSDGTVLPVTNAGMVVVGPSSAIVPTAWSKDEEGRRLARCWRTIALVHIVQFTEFSERLNGRRRR